MVRILGDIPPQNLYPIPIAHSGNIAFPNRHVQIMEGYITAVENCRGLAEGCLLKRLDLL